MKNGKNMDKARMMRSLGLSAALSALFVAGAVPYLPVAPAAFAQEYRFQQVDIKGNQYVDAATILKLSGIKRGAPVNAAQFNDAYQKLQNSGLFEEVELQPRGATLAIRVKEYPMINVISFEGNKRLSDEVLEKAIQSKSRRVYSPAMAQSDALSIAEGYRTQGRLAATIEPKIIRRANNLVDLVFEITEGKPTEVERLSFVGNRAFSDWRLRQVLETKQAGLLRTFIRRDVVKPETLDVDKQLLRDFYLSRGYVDFQVIDAAAEVTRERDGAFVVFTVQEGQQFRFGTISVASEVEGLDAAAFRSALRLKPGGVYNPTDVDRNIARLENLALQKGLNFVSVEPRVTRNERAGTLDIAFTLVRAPKVFVERIDIEGNTTTMDEVVRRQFRTVEGDPLNAREIRQSAERIRALGYFKDAKVDVEPADSPDQVVVKVGVEEKPTGSLSFGASYGVSSGLGFNVGLTENNFLGRGQTVGANISVGTDNSNSSITFIEPAFLGRDLELKFNAYYNETDNQDSTYDTRLIGIIPALEFPVSEKGRVEVRYFLKNSDITGVYSGYDADGDHKYDGPEDSWPTSPIIERDGARGSLMSSGFGASYSYDTRLNDVNPKDGYVLRFNLDYAGVGGDINNLATSVFAMAQNKIWNEEITLRAIFEAGQVHMLDDESSRVTDRYFGGSKVRGFEPAGFGPRDTTSDDALGGNMFTSVRLEADFPLGLPEEYGITGGLFTDFGSVWGLDDVEGTRGKLVDDGFHLRSSIGFSVFWTTPIGPLRFNFAKAMAKQDYDKEQFFDLTISTKF